MAQSSEEISEQAKQLSTKAENVLNLLETVTKKLQIKFGVDPAVRNFTGRVEKMKDLHEALKRNDTGNDVSKVACVHGTGGLGKTEMCRKFIELFGKHYENNVIWLEVDNIDLNLKKLANHLQIPTERVLKTGEVIKLTKKEIIENIYTKLEKWKNSLIILNNATNVRQIEDFLLNSSSYKPFIVLTSRNKNWEVGLRGTVELIELSDFPEAKEFLVNTLEVEQKDEDLDKLVEALHSMPLALQQSSAYINRMFKRKKNYSVKNYLEEYQRNKKKFLNFHFGTYAVSERRYVETVFTTWDITLNQITEEEHGQRAVEIINILAYLMPDEIDFNILFNKNVEWEAIELLDQFSMITLRNGMGSIHRLVQEVIRLGSQESKKEKEQLVTLLQLVMVKRKFSFEVPRYRMFAFNYAYIYKDIVMAYIEAQYQDIPFRPLLEDGIFEAFKSIVNYFKNYNEELCLQHMEDYSLLEVSVRGNSLEKVKFLLACGMNKNVNSSVFGNLLHIVATSGCVEIAKYLVEEEGFSIHTLNYYGETAILKAAMEGHEKVIEYFIQNFSKYEQTKYKLFTKLYAVKDETKFENLRLFLNSLDANECKTMLHDKVEFMSYAETAIEKNYPNLISLLVKYGLNIYQPLEDGQSCLQSTFYGSDTRYKATKNTRSVAAKDLLKIHMNNNDDIYAIDNMGFPLVAHVFRICRPDNFQFFIDEGIDVHKKDDLGCHQYIHICAVAETAIDTLKHIEEKFAFNANVSDYLGRFPIHYKIRSTNFKKVEYFINKGINLHVKDYFGYSLLDYAMTRCDLELFNFHNSDEFDFPKKIEEKLFSRNCRSCKESFVWYINKSVIRILLENGLEFEKKNRNHCEPIFYAAYHAHQNIMELFIEKSKNGPKILDAVDGKNRNILHYAMASQNLTLVDFLITKAFRPIKNVKILFEKLFLRKSYFYDKYHKITVNYILEQCAKLLNEYDKYGCKPVHIGCFFCKPNIIEALFDDTGRDVFSKVFSQGFGLGAYPDPWKKLMLKSKIKVDDEDGNGSQPLHYATITGNLETVKYLIENLANVHHKNKMGQTPLHTAVLHAELDGYTLNTFSPIEKLEKLAVVKCLLENKADVNAVDKEGCTPLHYACQQNNVQLVELLLSNGKVTLGIKNRQGLTPLDFAKGNENIYNILQQAIE